DPEHLVDRRDTRLDLVHARTSQTRNSTPKVNFAVCASGRLRLDQVAQVIVELDHFEDARTPPIARAHAAVASDGTHDVASRRHEQVVAVPQITFDLRGA